MLAELSIKNFAIIESLSISFEKGLTVLTGETGAGKSIIIDAIGLLSGGRGSTEFVRYGSERAEIEGLFFLSDGHPCFKKLEELGIESSDGMVVLRRDISAAGKSVCRINGKLVTLGILREIGQTLVDIHGQHENQALMGKENHLQLLDQYDQEKIRPTMEEYLAIYRKFVSLKQQVKKWSDNEKDVVHRLDLLQYQQKEIQEADLKPHEDEELSEERRKLVNYEKMFEAINGSYEALYGEKKALDWIGLAMGNLENIADLDDELKKMMEAVTNSFYLLEETAFTLRDKLDSLEFDPARLDFIEKRLNEINFLKKKYGETVLDILEYAAQIEDEMDTLQNRDQHLAKMQEELKELMKDLLLEAKHLSEVRRSLAKKLTEEIHEELLQLHMAKTEFKIDFKQKEGNGKTRDDDSYPTFTKYGIDDVEFLISTNPGEPLKPLSKVASGGELSRIMLAIKSIFSEHQGITSIIFDEVDTGVSGRVAQAIAEKIFKVSVNSQVLCISHLPQVAAMADTHLHISKESMGDRTVTTVLKLDDKEKIKEIGRMISGVEVTELTKQHARELLELADKIKATS